MTRKDNKTYREARRCWTCHWVSFKTYGASQSGCYCTRYENRCCKNKVCDSHMTEAEYEALMEWLAHMATYWGDEPKMTISRHEKQ